MSSSQKQIAEKVKTRGKFPTATSPLPPRSITHDCGNDANGPTLSMIMKRLDKLDSLEDKIVKLTSTTEAFKQSTEGFIQKTTSDLAALTERMDRADRQQQTYQRTLAIMDYKLAKSDENNRRLQMRMNELENKAKECNLKIEGKVEQENEQLERYILELANYLTHGKTDRTAIVAARRLGKQSNGQPRTDLRALRPRPILITFRTVQERNQVYYARTRLRNSEQYRQIYLNDDATQMTRTFREDYRSVAALVRRNDKEVRLHDNGIVIEGRKYKHGEANQLPAEFMLEKAKTVKIGEGLYFQSEKSFLSNFHPAPIIDEGYFYPTAEHMFQAKKCEMVNDLVGLSRIKSAHTPLEAKRIGDQIQETSRWTEARESTLKQVLDLKFDQNMDLAKKLIHTGKLTLHEATPNAYYGIGAALHSRELRNCQYTGLNKLGYALMDKRSRLIAEAN